MRSLVCLVVLLLCWNGVLAGTPGKHKHPKQKRSSAPPTILPEGPSVRLGTLKSNLHDTSVSGHSSGAVMAVQMHVAYSSIMKGAASFAGGPFHCAMGQKTRVNTVCTDGQPPIDVNALIHATERMQRHKLVDRTKHLNNSWVLIFHGGLDQKVLPPVKDALVDYYKHYITEFDKHVTVADKFAISHAFPTWSENGGIKNCANPKPPFIGSCGYDGATAALLQIYDVGHLRWSGPLTTIPGQFTRFDQTEFIAPGHGMGPDGFLFVPDSCSATRNTTGAQHKCPLHVVFHGCGQSVDVTHAFLEQTGFIRTASTNNIILLFPQARAIPNTTDQNGCWDWWGYTGKNYDTQQGMQMKAVRDMISRVTGTGSHKWD